MADDNNGGSNSFLAFLVGGLLIAVVGLGIFMYTGGHFGTSEGSKLSVDVNTPDIPKPEAPDVDVDINKSDSD